MKTTSNTAKKKMSIDSLSDWWDGEYYHHHSPGQEKSIQERLTHITFTPDEHILDVGCGDGRMTALIAEKVTQGSVIGLDSSESMIQFAQKTFPPNNHPNLRFECGSAESIPYHNRFDRILSFNCLHWVADHHAVLTTAAQSLKPHGSILFTMMADDNLIVDVLDNITQSKPWSSYFIAPKKSWCFPQNVETYKTLLKKTGFIAKNIKSVRRSITFDNEKQLLGSMKAWIPHIKLLDPSLHDAFLHDILQYRLIHQNTKDGVRQNPDGSFDNIFHSLFVEAVKK